MSSQATPFGLKPAFHQSGCLRQAEGQIESGLTSAISQYSPVSLDADGFLVATAPGSRAIGSFMGVEYTTADGRRQYSNQWLANTVATDIVAYYTADQVITYEVQANATVTINAMYQQFDWSALAGSATTGLSSVSLNVASLGLNGGLKVVGLTAGPDNEWGDAFPILQVQIAEHQATADLASV